MDRTNSPNENPYDDEFTDSYISGITTTGGETNFANTNNGAAAYSDYTGGYSVSTYAGGSFVITATDPAGPSLYGVFIDWNNNFDFTDEGERVINTGSLQSPAILSNITIPAGTAEGSYRMRIRNTRVGSPVLACGALGSGEAEDYTLHITAAPICFTPYGLTINPTDVSTVSLSWSPPLLGTAPAGYEYVFIPSATLPTAEGIAVTGHYIEDITFDPAQSVYLFVRSDCGGGDYSAWANASVVGNATPELSSGSVMVFKDNNVINITSENIIISDVTIYDISGRELYSQPDINATATSITGLQIQQQVLIVEITSEKGKVSKRIIFLVLICVIEVTLRGGLY